MCYERETSLVLVHLLQHQIPFGTIQTCRSKWNRRITLSLKYPLLGLSISFTIVYIPDKTGHSSGTAQEKFWKEENKSHQKKSDVTEFLAVSVLIRIGRNNNLRILEIDTVCEYFKFSLFLELIQSKHCTCL